MSNPPGEFTSLIPNSKKVVKVLISKFPLAGKTIVAIFYEIGIRPNNLMKIDHVTDIPQIFIYLYVYLIYIYIFKVHRYNPFRKSIGGDRLIKLINLMLRSAECGI
jgi:hypothetical protein